jgi:proteasome lid subunit RPN8/RPN11
MRLREEVLEQAFGHLRRCGAGERECVVYLTGPIDTADLIDGVIHPVHTATAGGYEVGAGALAELWADLLAARRSVRAQVHTHPGAAYHSARDDDYALIGIPGYLSLVLPDFALGPLGLDGAFLARRDDDGRWANAPAGELLEIVA